MAAPLPFVSGAGQRVCDGVCDGADLHTSPSDRTVIRVLEQTASAKKHRSYYVMIPSGWVLLYLFVKAERSSFLRDYDSFGPLLPDTLEGSAKYSLPPRAPFDISSHVLAAPPSGRARWYLDLFGAHSPG